MTENDVYQALANINGAARLLRATDAISIAVLRDAAMPATQREAKNLLTVALELVDRA